MNITVYCGSNPGKNPHFLQAAREVGRWIARSGHALVYGGSSIGLMGELARTVLAEGGQAQGVEPRFFMEAGVAQQGLTHLHVVEDMSARKAKMIELGDAYIALPGGVGTLEEISEILSRIRLGHAFEPCCFLNIDGYYDCIKKLLSNMLEEGFIVQKDRDRIHFPETAGECTELVDRLLEHPTTACATASELAR